MGDDTLLRKIHSLSSSFIACGPAPQSQIQAAQRELDLLFPPSYRLFLENYGAVFGHGVEVAGLTQSHADDPPMWSDMLSSTLVDRRHNSLPDDSVYISSDGTDLRYYLMCSRVDPMHEGSVVEWGPDHDGGVVYSKTFISFMERLHDRG